VKGIILNLLERVVVDELGEVAWDAVLGEVGVPGAYTALGNYADDEVVALLAAVAARTGRTLPEALRWFGRRSLPMLAERYPVFFGPDDPVGFVLTLDDVIHTEVKKLYPGAAPPRLAFRDVDRTGPVRTVTIDYRSRRAMSDLAIGFLEGTADRYGADLDVQRQVLDDEGAHVVLICEFRDRAVA
jgi:hypothetical protein